MGALETSLIRLLTKVNAVAYLDPAPVRHGRGEHPGK
jgi:hypothetical protein